MLGPPRVLRRDDVFLTSLEQRLPAGNFYRHLETKLDLPFVRDWVGDKYAERGRPSLDPVVLFKVELIRFFEGLRSERKRMETADLNIAHRWRLGFGFEEPLPDHSRLTRTGNAWASIPFSACSIASWSSARQPGWCGARSAASMARRCGPTPTATR